MECDNCGSKENVSACEHGTPLCGDCTLELCCPDEEH